MNSLKQELKKSFKQSPIVALLFLILLFSVLAYDANAEEVKLLDLTVKDSNTGQNIPFTGWNYLNHDIGMTANNSLSSLTGQTTTSLYALPSGQILYLTSIGYTPRTLTGSDAYNTSNTTNYVTHYLTKNSPYCYQELSNNTNCGNSTTNSYVRSDFYNTSYAFDRDWNTFATANNSDFGTGMFIDYKLPSDKFFLTNNTVFQIKTETKTLNYSLLSGGTDCISKANTDRIIHLIIAKISGRIEVFCPFGEHNWQGTSIDTVNNSDVYEIAVFWEANLININSYSKFDTQPITGVIKRDGVTINPINYLSYNGSYNFSFSNASWFQKDLVYSVPSSGLTQINIFNVSNSNLSLTVKDNDSGLNLTGVTISITANGVTENNLTTTNPTIFGVTQNLNYTIVASKTGYISQTNTVNVTNGSYSYTINLKPSNKVYISIVDEVTSSSVAQLVYVYFQNDDNLFNYSTTTGYLNATNISSGTYTLSFITANGNYTTQTYQAVINDATSPSITARLLLNTTTKTVSVYAKTTQSVDLENVLITVQRQYLGGSYATVAQYVTDVNGLAIMNIEEAINYRIILTASGYATKQFNQIFYEANSPYTWRLSSSTSSEYTNVFQGILYYYTPTQTVLSPGTLNFSITTYNATNSIAWTAVSVNGATTNVSGSSAGGTASKTFVATNTSQIINVTYSFNYLDPNTNSYQTYSFDVGYYINVYTATNNTIIKGLQNLADDAGDGDGKVWLAILATFITVCSVIVVIQFSGNQNAGLISGLGAILFFGFIGWTNLVITGIAGVIIVLTLYMQNR